VAELPEKLGEGEQAIIQHTAQYAARNGRNFLLALSEREKNNPQFEFLRPSSKSHLYFTRIM
jgi:splicing factor 3A subunit 1